MATYRARISRFSFTLICRTLFWALSFLPTLLIAQTQGTKFRSWTDRIDSLIPTTTLRPFNGKVLIVQGTKPLYAKSYGMADLTNEQPFGAKAQFVIGSVSKQITAVLVLQAVDAGLLDLNAPLHRYMPELVPTWADTVTAHHLLNHTSGIQRKDTTLAFKPGSRFSYSNTGYNLLGELVARVRLKSYSDLAMELFKKCGMKHSCTPFALKGKNLVLGHSRQPDGKLAVEKRNLITNATPSGYLISCPADLVRWNDMLHIRKKLLSPAAYVLMTTPSSVRDHPIFGNVDYGYGLQFTLRDGLAEISHGGYAPGYVTINFFYPESKTSLIVMENLDWQDPAFKDSYHFEMAIRKILRDALLSGGRLNKGQ